MAQKEVNEIRERELKAERDELMKNIEERRLERIAISKRSERAGPSPRQPEPTKEVSTEGVPDKTHDETTSGTDIKKEEKAHKAGLKK